MITFAAENISECMEDEDTLATTTAAGTPHTLQLTISGYTPRSPHAVESDALFIQVFECEPNGARDLYW